MNAHSRRRYIVVLSSILMILIVVGTFLIWKKEHPAGESYKDYNIVIKNAVYSTETGTGCIDLEVQYKKMRDKKLFRTSDDVLKNGYKDITDDEQLMRVVQDDTMFLSKAEELGNTKKAQHIKVYFINESKEYTEHPFYLTISEGTIENRTFEVDTDMKMDSETIDFVGVTVSSTGILTSGNAKQDKAFAGYDKGYTTAMRLNWLDESKLFVLNEESSATTSAGDSEILKSKLLFCGTDYNIYAIPLDDWQGIYSYEIGGQIEERNPRDDTECQAIEDKKQTDYEKALTKLTEDELKEYNTGLTFQDLTEQLLASEADPKLILVGVVEIIQKDGDWGYIIHVNTSDGDAILYLEGQEALPVAEGDKCIACVSYRGQQDRFVYTKLFKADVVKRL